MVNLVNLDDPCRVFRGRIFWDMLRPGVRLAVLGPEGCVTSMIRRVVETGEGQYYIRTRHSRYVLTKERHATPAELEAAAELSVAS